MGSSPTFYIRVKCAHAGVRPGAFCFVLSLGVRKFTKSAPGLSPSAALLKNESRGFCRKKSSPDFLMLLDPVCQDLHTTLQTAALGMLRKNKVRCL